MSRSVFNVPAADSRADRLATSRAMLLTAFLWGLSEATFFFIVPDVLLTWAATRSLRSAIQASLAALVGALIGGAVMVAFAAASPDTTHAFLLHIPGINAHLLARVSGQVDELHLLAVLFGPLKGIPYKIYAVEWGTRGNAARERHTDEPLIFLRVAVSPRLRVSLRRVAASPRRFFP
ncbi:MAG: hypothetical protein ACJ74J_02220 [Blastocatellia bacterium]